MKKTTDRALPKLMPSRSRFRRREWIAASVLLAVGAAALIGWIFVELYVKVVTMD